jgi:hypothetical protein
MGKFLVSVLKKRCAVRAVHAADAAVDAAAAYAAFKCSIYSYHRMGKFLVSVAKKRRAAMGKFFVSVVKKRRAARAFAASEAAAADAVYFASLEAARVAISARHRMHQQLHWSSSWHLTGIGATEESHTSTAFGDEGAAA